MIRKILIAIVILTSQARAQTEDRVFTCAFELSYPVMGNNTGEGFQIVTNTSGGGIATLTSGRTGKCLKMSADGFFGSSITRTGLAGTGTCFQRIWLNYPGGSYPNTTFKMFELNNSGNTQGIFIRFISSGKLVFGVNGTNLDTTSSAIPLGTWFLVKIRTRWSAPASHEVTMLGQTFWDGTSMSSSFPDRSKIDWEGIGTDVRDMYFDDLAINDSISATDRPPSDSAHIGILLPKADSARTGWVNATYGTTNLWSAVDSVPYYFFEANDTLFHISDSLSSSTDYYAATMQTYAEGGILAADTVKLVLGMVRTGEHATTGTKTGSIAVTSNPADGGPVSFTFGEDAGAHLNDKNFYTPILWRTAFTNPVYLPSVTHGVSPTLTVVKTTATTARVCVDFMGMLVEYTLGPTLTAKQRIIN